MGRPREYVKRGEGVVFVLFKNPLLNITRPTIVRPPVVVGPCFVHPASASQPVAARIDLVVTFVRYPTITGSPTFIRVNSMVLYASPPNKHQLASDREGRLVDVEQPKHPTIANLPVADETQSLCLAYMQNMPVADTYFVDKGDILLCIYHILIIQLLF